MSLAVRVIPCLDVDAGRVVKGVHFENLRDAGDPVELAAEYYRQGADELTFLDVTASSSNRQTTYDIVTPDPPRSCSFPLTVGGAASDPRRMWTVCCGAAPTRWVSTPRRSTTPGLIERIADRFGSQVLVLSVDARRERGGAAYAIRFRGHHDGRPQVHRHRCDLVGQAGRGAGRGGDPAQLDGCRRHRERVRPGDDPCRPPGGLDPDHRLRRCGQGGRFPRRPWRPGPTPCWPPPCSTTAR